MGIAQFSRRLCGGRPGSSWASCAGGLIAAAIRVAVFIVAVSIAGEATSARADEPSQRERLLREGPIGWARLAGGHDQIVARGTSVTRSVGVQPLHAVPRLEEWEMMRNGELVRGTRVRRREDGTKDTATVVFGPKFGFTAVKVDEGEYRVVSMGPSRVRIDSFVGNGIGAYLNAAWSFMGRSFGDFFALPQVQLGEVETVEEAGRTLVVAEFRYTPGENEKTLLSGNRFFFDPAEDWAVVRGELQFGRERNRYEVEYGDDVGGVRTPMRVRWIRPVDGGRSGKAYHELRFAFQEVNEAEVAEEEFTLAAFGLADQPINIPGGKIVRRRPAEE